MSDRDCPNCIRNKPLTGCTSWDCDFISRKEAIEAVKKGRKMEKRNLDGIYFSVKRDGKWQNVCFTDMTEREIEEVVGERSAEWWKSIAMHLKERINWIGDMLDISCE